MSKAILVGMKILVDCGKVAYTICARAPPCAELNLGHSHVCYLIIVIQPTGGTTTVAEVYSYMIGRGGRSPEEHRVALHKNNCDFVVSREQVGG